MLFKKLNVFFKNDEKVYPWYCHTNKHTEQLEVIPRMFRGWQNGTVEGRAKRGKARWGRSHSDPLEREPFITD